MKGAGTLRNCPRCFRPWPESASHDLRSLVWLDDLPRGISASNADALFFHDGFHGRDRFLVLETKRDGEPWQGGQQWLLRALAAQPGWTVRVLRGALPAFNVQRVSANSIEEVGAVTSAPAFRSAVVDFLNGQQWTDAPSVKVTNPVRTCPGCGKGHPVGTFCWEAA